MAAKPLPQAIKDYISGATVCRIATVKADGAPHVIPVCPVFDGDRTVYIDLGRKSVTAMALRSNPRIAVLFDEYYDDWTKLRKVLLHCSASVATPAEQAMAWESIRAKFPQYVTVDWQPRMTMALRIDEWTQEGVLPAP